MAISKDNFNKFMKDVMDSIAGDAQLQQTIHNLVEDHFGFTLTIENTKKMDSPFSLSDVTSWFATKGGLPMVELRKKAAHYNIKVSSKLTKAQLKEEFLKLLNGSSGGGSGDILQTDDESSAEDTKSKKFTAADIEGWFAAKGGLKLDEIREKAKYYGVTYPPRASKTLLKKFFENHLKTNYQSDPDTPDSNDVQTTTPETPSVNVIKANKCMYVQQRGAVKGVNCSFIPKNGEHFCAKHINTPQAIKYIATESPEAIEYAQKMNNIKVKRNSQVGAWQIDGSNLIINSPKDKKVVAFITQDGDISKLLDDEHKKLAQDMGLSF